MLDLVTGLGTADPVQIRDPDRGRGRYEIERGPDTATGQGRLARRSGNVKRGTRQSGS
jgi:hypothetical protein